MKTARRAAGVKTHTHQGGGVLFDADSGREHFLNATAFFVWSRMNGRPTVELAEELVSGFEGVAPETAAADVETLVSELLRQGFAEACEPYDAALDPAASFPTFDCGPRELDLSITGKCNLHCAYCFYADEMQGRKDLPTEEWVRFFAELGPLPVRTLCLAGGEAFVRRDLWTLVDELITHRMRFSILTNGTLVTERSLLELTATARRARLDSIQVSIDGSCAEVHDASRGRGSFVKALRGLRLLKEAELPVTVRVTVNRHNVADLDSIARLLLEEIGLHSFSTNDAMPIGAGCSNQAEITLTQEQQCQAMATLERLATRYDGRVTAQAGPLARARMWADMERARATGEMASSWVMGSLTACGCVFSKLDVLHDGAIVPCCMLPSLVLGRINRDSLSEVWQNHPTLAALKKRRTILMRAVPGCGECDWAPYCNGGCPGLAMETTGGFNRANPHDCYAAFCRQLSALPSGVRRRE